MVFVVLAACGGGPPPTSTTPPVVSASQPPPGVTRIIVGGDSRDDAAHVVPWAFRSAIASGARAFVFLGDMELTPQLDATFAKELALLGAIPFYPVLGNHEVKTFGLFGIDRPRYERKFRAHFLDTPRTPVTTSIDGKVVYSVDLPGGVHFIALDNVSQKGFGDAQLAWLARDLDAASADAKVHFIVVGMHKPLAHNGITTHSMDHDGPGAIADSDAALALFQQHHVAMIFASHDHRYASFTQGGIPSYITGGLGAPLDRSTPSDGFHHYLQLDFSDDGVRVEVVHFPGAPSMGGAVDDD